MTGRCWNDLLLGLHFITVWHQDRHSSLSNKELPLSPQIWKLCRCGESKEEERCNYTVHQHQEIMECLKEKTSNCCADEVQKLCGLQAEINFHNLPKQIDTDGNNCSCLELKFEKDLFSFKFWYKLGYDYRLQNLLSWTKTYSKAEETGT